MIFDTFLILAMAQAAATTIVKAIPIRLQFSKGIGHVVFRDPNTGKLFTVKGMTVDGGKGAWARYNRMFNDRTFTLSLNADGEGVHYAEGIRWDDSTENWVEVPKPDSCLWVRQVSRLTYETVSLVVCFWNPTSFSWDEDSIVLPKTLYQDISKNTPLRCLVCYSKNRECACHSVPQILQILERLGSVTYSVELNHMCGRCQVWNTTPNCLVCSGDYTRSSLVGSETYCPICHQDNSLDLCVAVRNGCCRHSFHEDCIERSRFLDNRCPICRSKYPPLMDDGDSDRGSDAESDGYSSDCDYYDPMDDCSDCGNPNCHCQFNRRW
jgi:hypothetical protein